MSDERVRNEVTKSVVGQVTQVGTVHIHAVPVPPEPYVDLAVRIAKSLTDTKKKTDVLLEIAGELFEADPERCEQVLAHAPDVAEVAEFKVMFAVLIATRDPERASRMVEPFLNERTDDIWVWAVLGLALSRTSPDRTALLVRDVDERQEFDADTLAWLAAARHPDDPRDFTRLAGLAERTALKIADQDDRNRELRCVADQVAAVDLDRAIAILGKISPTHWASDYVSPGDLKNAANRDYALALFDHYFQALRVSDAGLDYRRENLAVAAAAVDLYRAEAIASRITTPSRRVAALTAMAQEIAATDRGQACQWLADAFHAADSRPAPESYELLSTVAIASAKLDPALSRRSAQLIIDAASKHGATVDLCAFAGWLAETDPAISLQLVDRVHPQEPAVEGILLRVARSLAEADPATALSTLDRVEIGSDDSGRRIEIARILIEIATNLAVWDPAHAKAVLNRAQREMRAVRFTVYDFPPWESLATALVRVDPSVLERLAGQMAGQDDVLKAMALGVVKATESRTA